METSPTEKKSDRPLEDIKILSTEVFVDPYPDAEQALVDARKKDDIESGKIQPDSNQPKKVVQKTYGTGIGKESGFAIVIKFDSISYIDYMFGYQTNDLKFFFQLSVLY